MGHRGAVNGTAESRPKAPAGNGSGQFLGPHIAAGEGQMAVGDVKALHHAIAVKPVVVAGAAESVRTTIKRPGGGHPFGSGRVRGPYPASGALS